MAKLDDLISEALDTLTEGDGAWERLQDVVLGGTPVRSIREFPAEKFEGRGLAAYLPRYKIIALSSAARDPWRLYAVAHEAGHALGGEDEAAAWEAGKGLLQKAGIRADVSWSRRMGKSLAMRESGAISGLETYGKDQRWPNATGAQKGQGNIGGARNRGKPGYPLPSDMRSQTTSEPSLEESADPSDLKKGIPHLDDLTPERFMEFLRKYADHSLELEISEKVDGSARMSFGPGAGHIWTQSKNGSRKARSDQYPDVPVWRAIRHAHAALESGARDILAAWPEGVSFMVAEVLYTRIPNSIEYGPNVIMVHGVHSEDGHALDDSAARKAAQAVAKSVGGKLADGEEEWLLEYKRTINPKDVQVDVRKEYDTLGELYKSLSQKPRDKALRAEFQKIQKAVKEKLVKMLRTQRSAYGPEGGDVEGLVFRDLETGALYKLVDKDLFTRLNQFLWQWREMLDKGVKVGENWKPGIMQAFRNVVADQVLGSPVAKTPGLVKYLVRNYGSRAVGKTPEERADSVLAQYVKDENLMSGEFAVDFQRSLMGAFSDLQKLRREWDEFKKEPRSIEVGGKRRGFSQEHTTRTDEAFASAEESLQGIKAAMGEVGKIREPLTQKVALLKLFMGHRFEKLVEELSGPLRESVSGDFVPWKVLDKIPDYMAELIAQNADKLAKRGIRVGEPLGVGHFGVAYEMEDGRVLKITRDAAEARTSNYLKGKRLKHVAQVFDVFRFPPMVVHPEMRIGMSMREHFGIVLERLEMVVDHALDVAFLEMNALVGSGGAGAMSDPQMSWDQLKGYLVNLYRGQEERAHEIIRELDKVKFGEMRAELLKHGIEFEDFHMGNIGKRPDGTWVVFDLGDQSISPGAVPPVLEGGPIDRMTGPTDFSGHNVKPDDPDATLEGVVRQQLSRMVEAVGESRIGATIGRFQPFHAGHAAIIRDLAARYTRVIVFVAGQRQDRKNPFDHELRTKMMEISLPDVWSKIEVLPAMIQGKGTGYIPGLLANAAATGQSAVKQDSAVQVLVGQDRLATVQKQSEHNRQHSGEPGYFTGSVEVLALPDVKSDDVAGRVSGTRLREALVKDDRESVEKMLDPRLVQSAEFETIYVELRKQLQAAGLLKKIAEAIIAELGMGAGEGGPGATRGGRWGSGAWSSYNPRNNGKDDPLWTAMLRSPSTRMLQMGNHGVPNENLPGQDALDQKESSEQDIQKPTDLGEAVVEAIAKALGR